MRKSMMLFVLGVSSPLALPAAAQEDGAASPPIVHSIVGGVLAHDAGPLTYPVEDGVDINGEVQFTPFGFEEWGWIGAPRPHLGGTVSTSGDTSQIYGGLTWGIELLDGITLDGSAGLMAHNGNTGAFDPDRRSLGSRVLFRFSLEAGYRFAEHHGISLYASHSSHAGWFDDDNAGLEDVGVRYHYYFGQ